MSQSDPEQTCHLRSLGGNVQMIDTSTVRVHEHQLLNFRAGGLAQRRARMYKVVANDYLGC